MRFAWLISPLLIVLNGYAQSFSTTQIQPISESSNHTPTVIGIAVSGLGSTIDQTFGLSSVCLNINHPELNNLTIKLVAPDGTKVTLFHQLGNTDDDLINTCFDDVSTAIYNGSAPFTGTFRSTLPLGQVNNGQNPNGSWDLWIYDDISNVSSTGTFMNATLTFSAQAATPFSFYSSELPIINLETQQKAINNYTKEKVSFTTFDSPSGINQWQTDAPTFSGSAYIEWQGWSAPGLPKKNFDFDMADASGIKMDVPLLGMPAENDWVLKAEYLDRTLMKNHLVFDLFQKMGHYAPRTRYCEVVLDGEYLGIYTLQEKIKRNKNRVNIDKLQPNELTLPDLSGGYIYEINNTGAAFDWTSAFAPINDATTNYNVEFRVVYPDRDALPAAQLNYLKAFTDSFEVALASPQFQDSTVGYRAYTDVYSFIDFMLISEFAANYDTYGRSFFLTKENLSDGGKLKAGPPWDFDQAFGWYIPSPQGWVWEITNYYWPFPFWWSKFWSDEQYRRETECRWKSYRQGALSDAVVQQTIDSLKTRISSCISRNDFVWPSTNGTTYLDNVNNLQTWITQRLAWMDDSLNQYNVSFPSMPLLGDTSICAGDSLQYNLPTYYYYDWDPGPKTQVLVPTESGFYTLTVTDTLGCFSRQTLHIEARKPNVQFTVISLNGLDQVQISAQDSLLSSYLWQIDQQGLNEPWTFDHTFNEVGVHAISLTSVDSTGCSWAENQSFSVTSLPTHGQQFAVYPNPTAATCLVYASLGLVGKSYIITDLAGKIVRQGTIESQFSYMEIPWAKGVYQLTIEQETLKILKY